MLFLAFGSVVVICQNDLIIAKLCLAIQLFTIGSLMHKRRNSRIFILLLNFYTSKDRIFIQAKTDNLISNLKVLFT